MKLLLLFFSFLILAACANLNEPYYYNEIVVRNNTDEVLRDVKIQASKTNRMFRCANIAPGAKCSDKFPKRIYQGSKLNLFWVYKGKEKKIKDVVLKIPATINKETPFRGVLVVNADGMLRAFVEQGLP